MIYFVLSQNTGLIKIGYSSTVIHRIQNLKLKHGPLDLLGCVNGNRDMEKRLHYWFSDYSQGAEWFDDVPQIRKYISENKLADRLIVNESGGVEFYAGYERRKLTRDILNRVEALAKEQRMTFLDMSVKLFIDGLERQEATNER